MSLPRRPDVLDIPLSQIRLNLPPLRPLDAATVTLIADSMQQQGQLSPILVRPVGDEYELVYGTHRFAAARQLNWSTIMCEVRSMTDDLAFFAAWSENTARNEFVDSIAEGREFDRLTKHGYTQAAIARVINRPQQYVSGRISLLRLESEIQAQITSGLVPAEHGIELSRLDARTSRILAQLSRRDNQNPLRLEELRTLSRQPWEQLANDPRVQPLLANDPIEQIRRLRALVEQQQTTIQQQGTTIQEQANRILTLENQVDATNNLAMDNLIEIFALRGDLLPLILERQQFRR